MAVPHFTKIPCEPNTAYKPQRKYNIYPLLYQLRTLCRLGCYVNYVLISERCKGFRVL